MDRRTLLAHLPSGLLLSAASSLAPNPLWAAARARRQPIALLVPLSGPSAALGTSMVRAAMLAQSAEPALAIDTATGASAAAALAMKRGAKLILGPLFAADVRPVVAATAGRVPVLSFSNDPALRESGAFILGVTPAQSVSAILHYARKRGIRRIAVQPGSDDWTRGSLAAAQATQAALGMEIVALAADLAPGGAMPDALLVPQGGAELGRIADRLRGSGVQILGVQAAEATPAALAALEGAWFAAPDPKAFGDFAQAFSVSHGSTPGLIAALAYDGMRIADRLRAGGAVDRAALLATERFPGVAGALRFRSDGSCARELAILVAGRDGYATVDRVTGT